ncbi:MAG: hypothetical protein K9L65_10805 [Chromatiaceae bacterium]|nr:hypothetical protein [Chromatiaceae bacterium]
MVLELGRELGEATRRGAVLEADIDPEGTQHLGQMRLAAAVEAADPDVGLLGRMAEIAEEGLEDFEVGDHPPQNGSRPLEAALMRSARILGR